jgi:GDP-D-mannose 3', 5'-epimerase
MKKAIVFGAGGFIGGHLVRRLKEEGFWVRGVDLKFPEFTATCADDFVIGDLRNRKLVQDVLAEGAEELYQLAADMGGAGYLFSGENDATVLHNSALINLYTAELANKKAVKKIFFSSSACIYPKYNQLNTHHPNCEESSAYPADPDSEYGWEKLFSERLYQAFSRNFGLPVKIGRFHNVYGTESTWQGGREKAPSAICRKVAEAADGTFIEIWGDGEQTRSFLFIDDCLDGIRSLMESDFIGPVNIGSEEMVSIRELAKLLIDRYNSTLSIKYVEGPMGVRGRNSDNRLMRTMTGWQPRVSLEEGMCKTYEWVKQQVKTAPSNVFL